jgi:uncharacterized protein (TIGR02271 family)
MRTVVGLYERFEDAQRVIQALVDEGFKHEDISLITGDEKGDYAKQLDKHSKKGDKDVSEGAGAGAGVGAVLGGLGGLLVGLGALAIPGIGPVIAAGPIVSTLAGAGIGAVAGGLVGALIDLGIPEEDAEFYAEGVRRGGSLVVVTTDERYSERAASVMNRFNPTDVEKQSGRRQTHDMDRTRDRDMDRDRMYTEEEANVPVTGSKHEDTNIPIVEEELDVSKRQVDKGGVRVRSYIQEKPVERDVNLRKENIDVERRPVDREAREEDFRDQSREVRATDEEAVVNKRGRVVEEVNIRKDAHDETETVHDTLRRKDVEIERIDEESFRQHYQTNFGSRGGNYSDYDSAYRYGHQLGHDERYRDYDWNRLENQARMDWERQGSGRSWNEMRDAVRYGWESTRRTRR